MAASDHLLRTLAAVAPGTRIVEVGCADGRHTVPLVQLGFDVWACDADPSAVAASRAALAVVAGEAEAAERVVEAAPDALGRPDASAEWGVMTTVPDELDARAAAFAEAARVLQPGAWLWVQTARPEGLAAAAHAAGLVDAEEPAQEAGVTHAIFRRPDAVV